MWYSKILSNFNFSYLAILKILSVQGEWFSFEFWCPCLRWISSFWYPQILSNFIVSSYLPVLKISSVQRKWLNFEFWRACLKRIPSFWYPQILSNFIFSLYLADVKSSRTSLASRTSSRTHFEVLGLEALGPRKLPCPRLEDSTIF